MSYYDFTKQYGATQKAKFWCDYMAGLRGQLQALDSPRAPSKVSLWSRVNTNEVLLYDVLYGDYFRAADRDTETTNSFLSGWDPDPHHIRLPYTPVHTKIYGAPVTRASRISS